MKAFIARSEKSTWALMKGARRWLIATPEKVPHYIDRTKRGGKLDTPEDTARLASYGEAVDALSRSGPGWHLGFALGPDGEGGYWQGIDLDKIDDNLLVGFADALPGYVELSPSGKGVHAIGYGRHFRSLGSIKGCGVEAYASGRYFTVTENVTRDGEFACVADYVERVLVPIHRAACRASEAAPERDSTTVVVLPQAVADLRSALNFLRADNYHLWIDIGHALKSLGCK